VYVGHVAVQMPQWTQARSSFSAAAICGSVRRSGVKFVRIA
jgi:hypothetical protein